MSRWSRRKKKKVITTISVISVIVILILAFFIVRTITSMSTGQLSVNYSAGKNINATITGSYRVNDGEKIMLIAEDGAQQIVFNTDENTNVLNKNFKKVKDFKIKKDDVVTIEYTIKNNNQTNPLTLNIEADLTKCSNINVEYSINKTDWKGSIFEMFGLNGLPIANNNQMNFYIRITIDQKTSNAEFDGEFNFTLTSE